MGFSENPLSLSVPDEHFKTWAVSNSQAAAAEAVAATRRAPRNKCVLAAARARCRVRRRRRSLAESPGLRAGAARWQRSPSTICCSARGRGACAAAARRDAQGGR